MAVTRSSVRDRSRARAACATSSMTSARNTTITTVAIVSYLRWPYGWSRSGGLRAMLMPTRATMLDVPSVREWKPSDRMLTVPVAKP